MICLHAGTCGGCSLLHQRYEAQLASKEAALRALIGPLAPRVLRHASSSLFLNVPEHGSDPSHFRQKVAFVFAAGASGRGLVMGHYQRGSQRVVPVSECPVHSARGNRIAFALQAFLSRANIPAAGPDLTGVLRHLIVRTARDDGEAIAMLVVTRNDKALRAPIRAFLESFDRPDGFFLNINADPGPFMIGARTIRIDGRTHIREIVGGLTYQISPTAFFQTNVSAAAVLQQYVSSQLTDCGKVLDLYCGSGLFSLPLAARGASVVGIEENRQAVDDATANARLNGLPQSRVRFIAARVEEGVRRAAKAGADAVILDPPRQGCSDDVLEAVFQDLRPPTVVYVSCNPESLAAELPGIQSCGYRISELKAVDMFPHTGHLEAVVVLRRD
ncbi:MAG: 23S rRNA (uracil(1939)-C(5))-methyltransferase RlmD [Vicinamibacterales bacterium]